MNVDCILDVIKELLLILEIQECHSGYVKNKIFFSYKAILKCLEFALKYLSKWDFPAVQWLRLCASTAGGVGSILGRGTKIPHAVWPKKKAKSKQKNGEG